MLGPDCPDEERTMPLSAALLADLYTLIKTFPAPSEASAAGSRVPAEVDALTGRINTEAAADPDALKDTIEDARDTYVTLGKFIQDMSPYGDKPLLFPNLKLATVADRVNLAKLKTDHGIEVTGLTQKNHAGNRIEGSVSTMSDEEKAKTLKWSFRAPYDLDVGPFSPGPAAATPTEGKMETLQITKAIRIPYVYWQEDAKKFKVAHLVIGYEGYGSP
jgi:hypothetical protein